MSGCPAERPHLCANGLCSISCGGGGNGNGCPSDKPHRCGDGVCDMTCKCKDIEKVDTAGIKQTCTHHRDGDRCAKGFKCCENDGQRCVPDDGDCKKPPSTGYMTCKEPSFKWCENLGHRCIYIFEACPRTCKDEDGGSGGCSSDKPNLCADGVCKSSCDGGFWGPSKWPTSFSRASTSACALAATPDAAGGALSCRTWPGTRTPG